MSRPAVVFTVMLATPTDLVDAVATMRSVIQEWNSANSAAQQVVLLPVDHATDVHPEVGRHPQAVVNKQILDDADLVVAAFWTRLGTPTESYPSGTVEEIEHHVEAGKPALLYFSMQPPQLADIDAEQLQKVRDYKTRMSSCSFYKEFGSMADLRGKFARDLAAVVNNDPHFRSAYRAQMPPSPEPISPERDLGELARRTLIAAVRGKGGSEGEVMVYRHSNGVSFSAGNEGILDAQTGREEAEIEDTVSQLESLDLVRDLGHKREVFQLTKRGFQVADSLAAKGDSAAPSA